MSASYLLDTNVVSHIMQGRDAALLERLAATTVGQVAISSVTLAEIEYGLHRRGQPVRLRNALTQFLLRVNVLPWDEEVAVQHGALCSTLEAQGINLSDVDMMIAAHSVAVGATLVSHDKAFAQLPADSAIGFQLAIW